MTFALPAEALGIAVALGCGLLVGVEREQHKADHARRMPAGVRTCALIALAGALGALLGPIPLAIAGAFVALVTTVSYWGSQPSDPGLTTELVLMVVFLIGVLAMRWPSLAAALAVVVTILLQAKSWLHRFSRQVLSKSELNDALLLLASALVILPILPETPLGMFEGPNLRRVWTLVVLVMALNAAGYIAIRAIGPRLGLPLTGLIGGLVSSAATVASMGSRAKATPALERPCAAGAMASNLATLGLLIALLGAIDRELLGALGLAFGLSFSAALLWALWLGWHAWRVPVEESASALNGTRPFHMGHALAFAGLIALVLVIATWMQIWLGSAGAQLTALVAGFVDTHAPAISVAELAESGTLSVPTAAQAVLLAFSSNTLTKIVLAFSSGGRRYGMRLLPGFLLMLGAVWLGFWLS